MKNVTEEAWQVRQDKLDVKYLVNDPDKIDGVAIPQNLAEAVSRLFVHYEAESVRDVRDHYGTLARCIVPPRALVEQIESHLARTKLLMCFCGKDARPETPPAFLGDAEYLALTWAPSTPQSEKINFNLAHIHNVYLRHFERVEHPSFTAYRFTIADTQAVMPGAFILRHDPASPQDAEAASEMAQVLAASPLETYTLRFQALSAYLLVERGGRRRRRGPHVHVLNISRGRKGDCEPSVPSAPLEALVES